MRTFPLLAWLFAGSVGLGVGVPPARGSEGVEFFETRIRPLLVEHCYRCHSSAEGEAKGGLVLDTQAGWMNGGDSGPALVPGEVAGSLIVQAVEQADPDFAMPPKYKLSAAEIAALKKWVEMGAPDPRREGVAAPAAPAIDIEKGREFWSFRPVSDPEVPRVVSASWCSDPLDRFVMEGLERAGLSPVGDADRHTLIRRATFDLIGLPPTPAEIAAFVGDPAADREAFAKVVDRLLASPHFGERWGRHWLDVVRYGESTGRTRNYPFPFAWRYRDYVIAAFNNDKPYDRFLVEQLAGDLLPAASASQSDTQQIATGFLAIGSMNLDERNEAKFEMDMVDDQIDVTGRAFMALTTGCARCHDHKFDPIPTADYYALAGIFSSSVGLSGYGARLGGHNNMRADRLFVLRAEVAGGPGTALEQQEVAMQDGERRLRKQLAELRDAQWAVEGRVTCHEMSAGGRWFARYLGGAVDGYDVAAGRGRARELGAQIEGLAREVADLEEERRRASAPIPSNLAMGVRDSGRVADSQICVRGDIRNRGREVPRGFLQVLTTGPQPELPADASGRLELAEWMADPSHPLTARVMANRIWHHLFGRGIVRTVDNFGNSGERPSHPELLDHLAGRFSGEMGWSVKGLVRAVVLSRTYRLASTHNEGSYARDPENVLLWRANVRRLEAEALRDAMMHVSGRLDLAPAEGSPVQEIEIDEIGGKAIRSKLKGFAHRSVYLPIVRGFVPEFLETFDFAEPASVIGRRDVTTVSTQALYLLNDEFVIRQSGDAARQLLADAGLAGSDRRVAHAYLLAFGRPASGAELARARGYLDAAQGGGQPAPAAWAGFIQALFASAEFRYLL